MNHFLTILPMLFVMGLAGMLHCAGMCGGLAVLATGSHKVGCLAAYLTGKTSTYILLGTLAGVAGDTLIRTAPFGIGARALAAIAGFMLFLAGMDSLGCIHFGEAGIGGSRLSRHMAQLAGGGASGALLTGVVNGLLPCPMTFGFLAMAAETHSAIWGAATLVVLAVTSAVPLALCGLVGYRLGRWSAFPVQKFTGVLLLAMAVLTLYRGLSIVPMAHHMH